LMDDIYPAMRSCFSDEAGKALHNRAKTTLYQWDEVKGHEGLASLLHKLQFKTGHNAYACYRRVAPCFYFGGACEGQYIEKVAMKLIDMINDLASKKYILATLAPLSIIQMALTGPLDKQKYVIVSYLHLDQVGEAYVKATYPHLCMEEGAYPKEFGDDE